MEERDLIKELYSQGLGIRAISRQTGYARKTVRKYIKLPGPPTYKPRPPRPSKLDPYKEYICVRLKEHDLSAVRLLEEIRELGYEGGYTLVKTFVREVKEVMATKAVYLFETSPGEQAQVDWSEVARVMVDGRMRKLYCFNMVLGYSRMRYIEFTLKTDTSTFIQCHLNAFSYFGGYPDEVLYDNTKNVVIRRAMKASDSTFNPLFEDFFMHYGFTPRLCRVYRARTKGKVENTIKYVKGNFIAGRVFESLEDANTQRWSWLQKVNSKVHGTTHEVPMERLKEENLHPIDGKGEYIVYQMATRKVSRDCFVSYLGNRYSVPYRYAGREAVVRTRQGRLQVLIDGEVVSETELLSGTGRVWRDPEHFKGLLEEVMKEGNSPYRKLPLMNFSKAIEDVEVEKRSLMVYDQLGIGGGDGYEPGL